MPFCRDCGVQLSENAAYCVNCGSAVASSQQTVVISESPTVIAGWITRFAAWLIDIIVVTIALIPVKMVLGFLNVQMPGFDWVPFLNVGIDNVFYFLYWMAMEGIYSQSIGKMVVGIKITTVNGGPITLGDAVIESLGKAFLLPIDCLLGWILYPTKQQRLFNYLSDTTIVSTSKWR